MFPKPWINIDKNNLAPIMQRRCKFLQHNILVGIPYPDDSVSLIYHSDILEHLSYHEAISFLKECRRVLKPGDLMRVCVPDFYEIIEAYWIGKMYRFNDVQPKEYADVDSRSIKASMLLFGSLGSTQNAYQGHQMMYDADGLKELLKSVGFADVKKMRIDISQSSFMCNKDVHRDMELIMECIK